MTISNRVYKIKYTTSSASPTDRGRKCLLCDELFNVGEKCMLVMCNGNPFGDVLIHASCFREWDNRVSVVCSLIEEKYQAWCKLSGIWSPTVPEAGL